MEAQLDRFPDDKRYSWVSFRRGLMYRWIPGRTSFIPSSSRGPLCALRARMWRRIACWFTIQSVTQSYWKNFFFLDWTIPCKILKEMRLTWLIFLNLLYTKRIYSIKSVCCTSTCSFAEVMYGFEQRPIGPSVSQVGKKKRRIESAREREKKDPGLEGLSLMDVPCWSTVYYDDL